MNFCQPSGYYKRFATHEVNVGGVVIGGDNPVRIQSMVNTPTDNVKATVLQIKELYDSGCEIARITIRNRADIQSFRKIKQVLRKDNYHIPLVADVHFSARIALEVSAFADKVRINPGNYSDVSKASKSKTFTEYEYKLGIENAYEKVFPLLKACKKYGTSLRIGVNHGSLAWRIVGNYGNTPEGMTESAMEFLRFFGSEGFKNAVVSMKASNPFTMIYATRMLVQSMYERGLTYPLHLGVTEAGSGADGIYRSGIGIGSLLCDGIGDTIRVSLSGDPLKEIPACREIISAYKKLVKPANKGNTEWEHDPFKAGKDNFRKDLVKEKITLPVVLPYDKTGSESLEMFSKKKKEVVVFISSDKAGPHELRTKLTEHYKNSNIPVFIYSNEKAGAEQAMISGFLMADKLFAGWLVPEKHTDCYNDLLRSSGLVRGATVYVSCPTCGRTSYNLENVAEEVKQRTKDLNYLKIAVMGCIVNGPGEMEDADYGILGEQKGKVSIYKGKACVVKGIDENIAAAELERIIRIDKGL